MDRPLDDIISSRPRRGGFKGAGGPQRRRGGGGGGGGGAGGRGNSFGHDDRLEVSYNDFDDQRSGGGVFRRNRANNRQAAPYAVRSNSAAGSVDAHIWEHDRYHEDEEEEDEEEIEFPMNNRNTARGLETGTKIQISNLAYSVLADDLKDLFESVGDIKRANVNFDRSGRSLGTATVVFSRRNDAVQAVKQYNNVTLDDLPMKITLLTNNAGNNVGARGGNGGLTVSVGAPRTRRIISQGGPRTRVVSVGGGRVFRTGNAGGRANNGARSGRGGRGGRSEGGGKRGGRKALTAEELDAEMDEYKNQE